VPLAISIAALGVAVGLGAVAVIRSEEPGSVAAIATGAIGFETFLGILAFAGAALSSRGFRTRLGLRRGRLAALQLVWLVLGTLGASFALDGLVDLSGLRENSALGEFERLVAGIRGPTLFVAVLGFAIAPGIGEELLCRGLIQRGLVQRLGTLPGIALASALFGALHVDPVHAVFAGGLGVYLGLVCHLAGSVGSAIVCHTLNNLVALVASALFPDLGSGGLAGVVGGSAVATGALWLVWRQVGTPPAPFEARPASPGMRDVPESHASAP
jgi:membrane protease YdiL (CAAX protease family)